MVTTELEPESSSLGPEAIIIGGSLENSIVSYQSSLVDIKEPVRLPNEIPKVDRLTEKNSGKTGVNKGKAEKKVAGKERTKRKKGRGKTETVDKIDDNQSEVSYQPDTDLSRSKASRKVYSKLLLVLM